MPFSVTWGIVELSGWLIVMSPILIVVTMTGHLIHRSACILLLIIKWLSEFVL